MYSQEKHKSLVVSDILIATYSHIDVKNRKFTIYQDYGKYLRSSIVGIIFPKLQVYTMQ